MVEPFEVRTPNFVQGLTLMISRSGSMVKVIGQRSRSPGQKNAISGSLTWVFFAQSLVCVCRSIMAKGLCGKETLTTRVAGGASMLRHFHVGRKCVKIGHSLPDRLVKVMNRNPRSHAVYYFVCSRFGEGTGCTSI